MRLTNFSQTKSERRHIMLREEMEKPETSEIQRMIERKYLKILYSSKLKSLGEMYLFLKAKWCQEGTNKQVGTEGSQVSMALHQKSRVVTEECICAPPKTPGHTRGRATTILFY